jgi:hypothetical protein
MTMPPAVIVHGIEDARRALAFGRPVTLLSAPGAALYMGVALWQAVVAKAREEHQDVTAPDILDCADTSGYALSALRLGQRRLVLWPESPGRAAVVAAASTIGADVLEAAPPALDLAAPREAQRLADWLGLE